MSGLAACSGAVESPSKLDPATTSGTPGAHADGGGEADASMASAPPCNSASREFFALQVWPTLSARCITCHAPDGIASTGDNAQQKTAGFVLQRETYPAFLDENARQLRRMVVERLGDSPKLLVKPIGGDDHGGGTVIVADGSEYATLQRFAKESDATPPAANCRDGNSSLFADVTLADWNETFRRSALALAGRLPTAAEQQIANEAQFDERLLALLKEPTFAARVRTYYNDQLLLEGSPVNCFAFPTSQYPKASVCTGGNIEFLLTMRRALTEEPLQLIENVVRKGAPFSEILTANYTMVNAFSALPYDVAGSAALAPNLDGGLALGADGGAQTPPPEGFEQWREVAVKTANGPYPHAGVLSTPSFLARWPSTPTNVNRARARVVFGAFLATDILTLARRPLDSSALTGVANAPRNASACTSCHGVLDPVANSFSEYADSDSAGLDTSTTAATNRHQEMFPPGFGQTVMPGSQSNMLGWLTQQIVSDPRFALSVVRIMYEGITGRAPLPYPAPASDAALAAQAFALWNAQDSLLQSTASSFMQSRYDLHVVVKAIVKSPFFRATGVSASVPPAVAQSVGLGLLTPEVLADRIKAVFGTHWGTWNASGTANHALLSTYEVLAGGIDSTSVVERSRAWNAPAAALASRMANEMACRAVSWDFSKSAADRVLFPFVERTTDPSQPAARKNVAYLVERFLGARGAADDVEVNAAFQLFQQAYGALKSAADPALPSACQARWDRSRAAANTKADAPLPAAAQIASDPSFTIRAWMALVTYLASDPRFLHY